MNSLAASGTLILNNSVCVVKGNFYKPETVLETVSRSQSIEDGVLEIYARDVSGRIGVSKNNVLTGGVVDRTGETGVGAICKLLLLPYATYSFRHAIPQDKLHLQQELNLHFKDVTQFLSGPSSIGLATPREHALTNLQALTVQVGPDFNWENTTLRTTEWEATSFRTTFRNPTQEIPYGAESSESVVTGAYDRDCNKLIEAADRKRTETIEVMKLQAKKTQNELQVLTPGPLPSRKKKSKPLNPVLVVAAVGALLGAVGFGVLTNSTQSQQFNEVVAAPVVAEAVAPVAQEAPKETAEPTGAAPFKFPNSTVPNPAASATGSSAPAEETEEEPTVEEPSSVAPIPVAPPTYSTAAAPSIGNTEAAKWMEAVRANPSDANARRELAQAYLLKGEANNSIEQFYAVMRLRKVDSSEVISYADNLIIFAGKDVARQFLSDVLRSDPSNSAIRERLSTMR